MQTDERITWLASYPKSGNTWVRCLLQAYRYDGCLDINALNTGFGDSSLTLWRAISPVPVEHLGYNGQTMLRPAALLMAMSACRDYRYFKTHCANVQVDGLAHLIPKPLTHRALYILRDPRSVVLSFSRFFSLSLDLAVDRMSRANFYIGDCKTQAPQLLTTWSNHVTSWCREEGFPVAAVKYEDLCDNTEEELKSIIKFLGWEYDEKRARKAIRAASFAKLRKLEKEKGFNEWDKPERGAFFNGTRWQDELGPKWIKRIESDHGKVMEAMGYL